MTNAEVPNTNVGDTISRQAAIDTVKKMRECCDTEDINDYFDLLIEAFNVLPSAQPDVPDSCVGDMINRQDLCDYALNQKDKSVTPNDIMRFPSAQPEPCNFCKHNDVADYIICLRCPAERREDETD